jgi:Fe-S-cluster containining protein
MWFEPEEINIREYIYKNKIKHVLWTREEFKQNNTRCPYLIDDRCIIYPVRPIVCRLQGNISELLCKSSENDKLISEKKMKIINRKLVKLIKKTKGMNKFYSTLKF